MVPRELIDTADVPGGEPLRLFRRGGDFMIVLDRNELMNSRMSGSEEALAVDDLRAAGRAQGAASADRRLRHGLHAARGAGGAGQGCAG